MTEFAFTTEMELRYRDLDPLNHVNNAVYSTFLLQSRIGYFDEVLSLSVEELDLILASVEIDFRQPVTFDAEAVEIAAGVEWIRTSSFEMAYEVRATEDVAAEASSVQVVFDRETGDSRPVPDGWVEAIEEYEGESLTEQ